MLRQDALEIIRQIGRVIISSKPTNFAYRQRALTVEQTARKGESLAADPAPR